MERSVFQKKIDVLLIQPPVRDFYLTIKRTIPYGLISIASALINDGFTVGIFDALATTKARPVKIPSEFSYLKSFYGKPDQSPFCLFHPFMYFGYHGEHIEKVIKESKARVVGISSLFTAYAQEAINTATMVKKVLPEAKVVLGGHHPTYFFEEVMKYEEIDFVIRGEGETAFVDLVKALNEKNDVSKIPGIVYRKPGGETYANDPAIVHRLDDLPLPAWDLVKSSFYQRNKKNSLVIVSSRGCPMKCSYCCVAGSGIPYRRRSVESVIGEIDAAVKMKNIGFIDFEDENISLNRVWFQKLLLKIIKKYSKQYFELRAMNGLFPPSLDEDTLGLMKDAGFKTLNLSVGTLSVEQLKKFNRPPMKESLEHVLTNAKKYDLESVCYLISAAPGQKAEDSLDDLVYMAQQPVLIGLSIYYPAPGSFDYDKLKKKGCLPEYFSLMRSSAIPHSGTTSRTEAITLLRLSRIINFMKMLTRKGETIPVSENCGNQKIMPSLDRRIMGRQLLAWFLCDGLIRGVTPRGEIYNHRISTSLTRNFIARMQNKIIH